MRNIASTIIFIMPLTIIIFIALNCGYVLTMTTSTVHLEKDTLLLLDDHHYAEVLAADLRSGHNVSKSTDKSEGFKEGYTAGYSAGMCDSNQDMFERTYDDANRFTGDMANSYAVGYRKGYDAGYGNTYTASLRRGRN